MQTATNLVPAVRLVLSLVRRQIMERMASTVFTPAERLRANDSVYQCDDEAQLVLWHRNVCRVELERTATQPIMPVLALDLQATASQLAEIVRLCSHPAVARRDASALLCSLRQLTYPQAVWAISQLIAIIWTQDEDAMTCHAQLASVLDSSGILHAQSPTA
jgi:hypothetical protein